MLKQMTELRINEIIDEEIILNYTLTNKKNKSKDCLIEE